MECAAYRFVLIKLHERDIAMDIIRAGSRPSAKGPTDWFTGPVRIDPLLAKQNAERVQGATVTFEPVSYTHLTLPTIYSV